ncbi:methyltransferase family protein [Nocardia sp. NPDC052566]|uniref:methyltransferase family protein n=1 Tax=Nocardia sp. NPDC052566 TaxID=3364330 RepID=UPI0037CC3CB2
MALAALILYAVFAAAGFGWRSWQQHRRTGSTGFRGISGRPGSAEWFAGIAFVAAIITGIGAPALQLAGILAPISPIDASWIGVLGVLLAVAGIAATVYAQRDMGDSWRIGVDASETTSLVRDGVFALVRNPIFTAMSIFATGIVLMVPNPLSLIALTLLITAIELQVRIVEEPYLTRTHGHTYRRYLHTVGRFVPLIGRP